MDRKDKTEKNNKYRLRGKADETVIHVVSECGKLAQKVYKRRHDWVGKKIHWEVCKKYGLALKAKWYSSCEKTTI